MAGRTTQHDECECPVCQEDYVDPKLLGCGHIICRQCVLTWLQAGGLQNGCPICRAAIISPRKGISETSSDLATLIDSLPTDVAVISMVECKQLLKGSHVCCVCDDNTSAFTVCMDCNIKLCQSCSKGHRKIPALREHVLEELVTLTPERLAALRKSSCDVHKERPAELYCPAHQSLVCLVCSSSTHRSCHAVTALSDFANSERQTLKMQCERLRQIKTSLEEQKLQLEQKICDVQAQSKVRKNEVKAMCDRLKQAVDRQCQILWNSVEVDTEVIVSKVNVEKSDLNIRHASVAAHVFVADRLVTTAADGSLVKTLPNVKASMSALESQNVIQSPIKENVVSFDSEMLNRLEKAVTVFEKMVATDVKVKKCQIPYECNPEETDELKPMSEEKKKILWRESRVSKTELSSSGFVKMENKDERNKGEEAAANSERTSRERPSAKTRLQPSYREYGFLIIGSLGAGKSSTGNTILGYQKSDSKAFKVKFALRSTKEVATSKREERCYGNNIRAIFTVVDTPNLEEEFGATLKEQLVELVGNEEMFTVIHVIRCDRFYKREDKENYLALKGLLSDRLKTRIIIGFTFFDRMDSENDIRDILLRTPTELSEALSDAQNRYVIFNNKADDEDKKNQVEALVDAVNFLEGNMKMKIGLLTDSIDWILSVKERIKQYLIWNGIDAMLDLVPVNKRSFTISRHHLFLYIIKENNLKEGVSSFPLLHELREKRFLEVRRRCIIVIAMERLINDDELLRAIQTNRNLNGLLQMFGNRYDQIVYTQVHEEGRKPYHSGESIHHDGLQDMDKQKIFKMIQTLVQQNCFTQYSFPEIARMQDQSQYDRNRSGCPQS